MPDLEKVFSNIIESEESEIEYFQRPEWYELVPEINEFMMKAREAAIKYSLTPIFPIGIVAVKEGVLIAEAGNGNGYHEKNTESPGHRKGCVRRYLNAEREKQGLEKFKSGEGFELCPGCHTDFHAEANLIRKATEQNMLEKLKGADLYMYGHFWCCKPCFEKMIMAGVKDIYLPDTYEKFKDKDALAEWAEVVRLARLDQEKN